VDNGKVWGIGPYAGDPIDLSGDGWLPDPDDPATAGCLLALLGPGVSLRGAGWHEHRVIQAGLTNRDGCVILYPGHTLGRACIAAAEALKMWPDGSDT
jgi:hypothetical protein